MLVHLLGHHFRATIVTSEVWPLFLLMMAVFPNRKFRSSAEASTFASKYRLALGRHPFLLFGLPFIATMVAGSFFLTPATAIRYEKHDRKMRRLSKEEELGIGKDRRKVDMKEEYYVSITSRDTTWTYADFFLYRD